MADSQAASGNNLDRFERQTEELGRLNQSGIVGQGDLPAALKRIAKAAALGVGGERATIWIYNADYSEVRCAGHFVTAGAEAECATLQRQTFPNYFGAMDRDRVCAVADTSLDQRGKELGQGRATEPAIRAFIAATFYVRGQKTGILRVDQLSKPREWAREDQFFISALADSLSLAIEVSERKRTEEALRRSEQNLRVILEAARDFAFLLLDAEGKYLQCSPGAEEILGFKEWELLGRPTDLIFTPEDKAAGAAERELEGARTHGRSVDERWHVRKDGARFWGSGFMYALRDQGGDLRGYAKVVRDITDRKLSEDQKQSVNELLEGKVTERTQELKTANEQLESFCYTIAHDLRAPLRSMQSFSTVLLDDFADRLGDEGTDLLRRIRTSATRMDDLINDLLDYSRVSRIKPTDEVTDLGAVVTDALNDLTADIKSRAAEVFVQHPLPPVIGNKSTVSHVVTNLLTNALKFTRNGHRPEVKIYGERRGEFVRLVVRDNGIGVADEHRERIFQIFERLHGNEAYPGTGVGLAIVKTAIERLGGRAGVDSIPGDGSSFWFELRAA